MVVFAEVASTTSRIRLRIVRIELDRLVRIGDSAVIILLTPIGGRAARESGGAGRRAELLRLDQARAGREGYVGILGITCLDVLVALAMSKAGCEQQHQRNGKRLRRH